MSEIRNVTNCAYREGTEVRRYPRGLRWLSWVRLWLSALFGPRIRTSKEARRLTDAALSDLDDVDPLREKLDELEGEVAGRRRRERQARCPHGHTASIRTLGDPHDRRLCLDCGASIRATREP